MIETPGQEKGGGAALPFLVSTLNYACQESQPHSMAKELSAMSKAFSKTPVRKIVRYKGEEYEFYHTHLTLAERAKIKAAQRDPDDANEFALKLLLSKAMKKNGSKMFADGMYAELKNEWPAAELEAAMLLLIASEDATDEAEEAADPKD